jgi:hypothetical protein
MTTHFISLTSPMPDGPDAQMTLNIADISIFGEPNESISREHPRANATIRMREYPHTIPVLESPTTIHALIHQARVPIAHLVNSSKTMGPDVHDWINDRLHLPTSSAITEEFKTELLTLLKKEMRDFSSNSLGFDEHAEKMLDPIIDLLMDYEQTAPADTIPEPPEGFSDWFNQTFMPALQSLGHTSTSFCEAFGASPVEYFELCRRCDEHNTVSIFHENLTVASRSGTNLYKYEDIWLPSHSMNSQVYHPASRNIPA